MANIGKFRAHESLNTDTAAVWDVITTVADANASGGAVLNVDVSGYHTIGLTPAAEIFIHFHNTSTVTLVEADALKLASGLSFLKIPKGLGKTIYFNYVATGASTVEVRIVKM
jgi:hypothetical protein